MGRASVKENKNLYLTELGEVVDNIMKQSFPTIVDVNFTANMESLLDGVAEGKVRWKTIIENFYPDLETAVQLAQEELESVTIEDEVTDEICEECGRNMVIKYGPHGKFLACPGFPECRNTKTIVEEAGIPCPDCGKMLIYRKTKSGRKYVTCSGYPDCKFNSWNIPTDRKCPKCGSRMDIIMNRKNYLICSNNDCKYTHKKDS